MESSKFSKDGWNESQNEKIQLLYHDFMNRNQTQFLNIHNEGYNLTPSDYKDKNTLMLQMSHVTQNSMMQGTMTMAGDSKMQESTDRSQPDVTFTLARSPVNNNTENTFQRRQPRSRLDYDQMIKMFVKDKEL